VRPTGLGPGQAGAGRAPGRSSSRPEPRAWRAGGGWAGGRGSSWALLTFGAAAAGPGSRGGLTLLAHPPLGSPARDPLGELALTGFQTQLLLRDKLGMCSI
jgi:hypothetical protein